MYTEQQQKKIQFITIKSMPSFGTGLSHFLFKFNLLKTNRYTFQKNKDILLNNSVK